MRIKTTPGILAIAAMAVLGPSLAACDEAEQGRILRYEKGTYLGQKDIELSTDTEDELRSRASMQRGI